MCPAGYEKITTDFNAADKFAIFKANLELWERRVNTEIFDMFHTLASIMKETEPGLSFTQLEHDHLS